MENLSREERMRLMEFVCSFAWTDLEVGDEERAYVARLMKRFHLDDAERQQVERWLVVPPPIDDVDPTQIPHKHRKLFLDTVRRLVKRDGVVNEEEAMSLRLFKDLTR